MRGVVGNYRYAVNLASKCERDNRVSRFMIGRRFDIHTSSTPRCLKIPHISAKRSKGPPVRVQIWDKIHQLPLSHCSQDEIASV